MISLTCGIQETKQMNKPKNTLKYREQTDGCKRGIGWGMDEKKEIKRYKLSLIKYVSHRDEKCNTRNTVNNIVVMLYGDYTYGQQ